MRPGIYRRRALRGWLYLASAILGPFVAIVVLTWLASRGHP